MPVPENLCILLVEDSAIMRQMEVKILKELGFTNLIEAEHGDAAIAHLTGGQDIHLIISDWNMPQKTGFELLNWLRAEEKFRHLPFIMATAESDKGVVGQVMAAGATGVVAKPFTPGELKEKIESAFAEPGPPSAAPPQAAWQPRFIRDRLGLKIAHIQITDHLVLGVLKHLIDTAQVNPQHFHLETACLAGWNPVQENLENGSLDGALVLAPIAMDLFGYGVPLKLVLLAHKNGSVCVRQKTGAWRGSVSEFFKDTSFYIPHKMSIHHMLAHQYFSEAGLRPGVSGKEGVNVFFEVVPPVKMPEFLANNPEASGFMVAEPIGTKAIAAGIAELQFLSSQGWNDHPCCVVTLREEITRQHPEAVLELTRMLVQAGQLIADKPNIAAEIAVSFLDPQKNLGLKVPVLKNVLTEAQGIRTDDLFPVMDDFERMQDYMVREMGQGNLIDLKQFVDTRFAEVACKDTVGKRKSAGLSAAETPALSASAKAMLEKEGKYLTFSLDSVEYGISILNTKEIIGMLPLTPVPHAPPAVKGVINLRGKVIPVVDLRLKFGLPEIPYNERTCIVILEIKTESGPALMGIVVDAVSEVLNIRAEQITDRPYLGTQKQLDFIIGMARFNDDVKVLLDIEQALSSKDAGLLGQRQAA